MSKSFPSSIQRNIFIKQNKRWERGLRFIYWLRSHLFTEGNYNFVFPLALIMSSKDRESYCPYTEKPQQAVFSPVLNPNSRTFLNGGKDSADRTSPPPGNSACRDGHSPCRACCTGACRSRPGRTPIPDAISCSGS